MTRSEGWTEQLSQIIDAHRDVNFEWGINDCASFSLSCAKAVCGRDIFADWRGSYSSDIGALKELKKRGFDSYTDAIDNYFERVAVGFAQRGDLLLVEDFAENAFGGALGVCLGQNCVFISATGLNFRKTLTAKIAWRVI